MEEYKFVKAENGKAFISKGETMFVIPISEDEFFELEYMTSGDLKTFVANSL